MEMHEPKYHVYPAGLRTAVMQLARFNLVGILNTLLDFGLFFLLSGAGVTYLLAQTCSYGCGIANSYMLNKYWTFGVTGIRASELFRFMTLNLSALAASVLLVYLFHSPLRLPLMSAKIAATLLTMLISFLGSKFWVFRRGGLERDRGQ